MLEIDSIAFSISSAVENLEIPNRSVESTSAPGRPIASSTWLGGLLPLLQADPLLQAMPARSRAISIDWRSVPRKEIEVVPGNRSFPRP